MTEKLVGNKYCIIYDLSVETYEKRGEYGGTGERWTGLIRIKSKKGSKWSGTVLQFSAGTVCREGRYPNYKLINPLLVIVEGWSLQTVPVLEYRKKNLIDFVALRLLESSRKEDRYESSQLSVVPRVPWSGLDRKEAVELGFVPTKEGQIPLEASRL